MVENVTLIISCLCFLSCKDTVGGDGDRGEGEGEQRLFSIQP